MSHINNKEKPKYKKINAMVISSERICKCVKEVPFYRDPCDQMYIGVNEHKAFLDFHEITYYEKVVIEYRYRNTNHKYMIPEERCFGKYDKGSKVKIKVNIKDTNDIILHNAIGDRISSRAFAAAMIVVILLSILIYFTVVVSCITS